MILVFAGEYDTSCTPVCDELRRRGEQVQIILPELFPLEYRTSIAVNSGKPPRFFIKSDNIDINCKDISSVWFWHPRTPSKAAFDGHASLQSFMEREWRWFINSIYRSTDAYWLNKPASVFDAEHKALQLSIASKIGFELPDTLITNDPTKVSQFYNLYSGNIIQKTLISQTAKNEQDQVFAFYTRPVSRENLRNISQISSCPVIYQQNIPKQYDIRITMVGEKCFATEIHSQKSEKSKQDFRQYDIENTPYLSHQLPKKIEALCHQIMLELDLNYGAIDLILTEDNRYIFLEVNPSGQYGWIQGLTGQPITEAIADQLMTKNRAQIQVVS